MSTEDPRKSKRWPHLASALAVATGAWHEKRRLAAAMRRVIEQLVSSDPSEKELADAADALENFADSIASYPRRTTLEGYAESSISGDVDAFFDRSPFLGLSNPLAPPITVSVESGRVRGQVRFGTAYEGPPGHVHGGYIAAVFDEVLGFAPSLAENPGMTGTLTVKYRRPCALYQELEFDAGIDRIEGKKILASGTISFDSKLLAEADGVFVMITAERYQQMVASQRKREQEQERKPEPNPDPRPDPRKETLS